MLRRALSFTLLLCCAALGSALPSSPAGPSETSPAGIFVLGIDGVDPDLLDRMMDEGRMPNFARLAEEGTYQRLGTSTPPQSPVAWSNFITGRNPGGHGMFDFIHRDPKTYRPLSSATRPPSGETPPSIELFGYTIPLAGDVLENNRGGIAFWDVLHEAGVDVEVYRIPGNYPPTPSEANFDSVPDTVHTTLKGPPDVLHLKPGELPGPNDFLTTGLAVHLDPEEDVAWLEIGDSDVVLRQGEWSDWVEVTFDALPWGLMRFTGIVRFYLKEVRPDFQLYASPVNLAPGDPAQPVTTPDDFIEVLYESLGNFYTVGMPEETNALKDGLFDDDDYPWACPRRPTPSRTGCSTTTTIRSRSSSSRRRIRIACSIWPSPVSSREG